MHRKGKTIIGLLLLRFLTRDIEACRLQVVTNVVQYVMSSCILCTSQDGQDEREEASSAAKLADGNHQRPASKTIRTVEWR